MTLCCPWSSLPGQYPRVHHDVAHGSRHATHGGDYVWISRILHPSAAVFSNFAAAISALIGAAFWARSFAVLALRPTLAALGAVTQNTSLIDAGNTVSAGDTAGNLWTFGLGTLLIVILVIAMSMGTKAAFLLAERLLDHRQHRHVPCLRRARNRLECRFHRALQRLRPTVHPLTELLSGDSRRRRSGWLCLYGRPPTLRDHSGGCGHHDVHDVELVVGLYRR